nr:MAG TPA: hypothetical protein [Caudoviricetes sp.]
MIAANTPVKISIIGSLLFGNIHKIPILCVFVLTIPIFESIVWIVNNN